MRPPKVLRFSIVPLVSLAALLLFAPPRPVKAQTTRAVGKAAALNLRFGNLDFDPPNVEKRRLDSGIPVFLMEDRTLPLVTLYARFEGGYALLPREEYAAATALPGLLRSGGTRFISPDSVDNLLDFYALQLTFGGGGESMFSSINTLTRHLVPAVGLWAEMLRDPGFDAQEVEVWRGRQIESVRRRTDDPGLLAFSEFNRLMFGDHPIGWEMTEEDLTPERLSADALGKVHARTFCPQNLILGVVGDVSWAEIQPLLDAMMEGWPSCAEPLLPSPIPAMRRGGGVFLIPRDVTQSTVIMAQPGGIRQSADPEYFASRIGNSILGASGFSSRLLSRVRTEKGYAYSASSLWTTPYRYEGIVGAVTQTKSASTIAATRLILETIQEMRNDVPEEAEVDLAVQQIVNGFVFNFQDPAQIVSRQMFYLSQGLPEDWLERYLKGIQQVHPEDVRDVFRRNVDPSKMTIMILGNPADFDAPPESLGEVQILDIGRTGSPSSTGPPRGGQRSPR